MTKRLSLLFIFIAYAAAVFCVENYYWIAFTDKHNSTYSLHQPELYLSEAAILRRQAQNIPIDSTDLPVNNHYIESVTSLGAKYIHQSKWLNGITVIIDDTLILSAIRQRPFVDTIMLTHRYVKPSPIWRKKEHIYEQTTHSTYNKQQHLCNAGYTQSQNDQIRVSLLHDAGFRGKGKRIAVIDTGFPYADTSIGTMGTDILGTYNIAYPNLSAFDQSLDGHGTTCLGLMAVDIEGEYVGTAPEASYYLIVSEKTETETLLELDHWVRAAEIADSLGTEIICSSLGYSDMDSPEMSFTYADMDGKTTHCSKAAAIAVRKGMIVCVSVGNEADNSWYYLTAPSDAEDVIAVGGVTENGTHSRFSSFGPTADGRIKPTVCARGTAAVLYRNGSIYYGNGTSFSAPIIAGAAASLWSALPEETNYQIMQRITETASCHDNPNDSLGYGIADFWAAYTGQTAISNTYYISQPQQISIYNTTGILIRRYNATEPFSENELQYLPHGAYIIQTTDSQATRCRKIII